MRHSFFSFRCILFQSVPQPTAWTWVLHLDRHCRIQASEYDWRLRCSLISQDRSVFSPPEAIEATGSDLLQILVNIPSCGTCGLCARHGQVYSAYLLLACALSNNALLDPKKVIIRAILPPILRSYRLISSSYLGPTRNAARADIFCLPLPNLR